MEFEIDTNYIFGFLAVLLVAGVGLYWYFGQSPVTSNYDFVFYGEPSDGNSTVKAMFTANSVYILMDSRGANQSLSRDVFNCGAAYARDLARIGKNISNFAVEYDYCILPSLNKTSLEDCNNQINNDADFILYIRPALNGTADVHFYSNWMEVYVPLGGSSECGLKFNN